MALFVPSSFAVICSMEDRSVVVASVSASAWGWVSSGRHSVSASRLRA
jgi:hypothetical protein